MRDVSSNIAQEPEVKVESADIPGVQMYNQRFLQLAQSEIEAQIRMMPATYTSCDFYTAFEKNYPQQYDAMIQTYRNTHDHAHAVQIAHTQLMHTVNQCFHHLTRKIRTIQNPKGGDMSEWSRV